MLETRNAFRNMPIEVYPLGQSCNLNGLPISNWSGHLSPSKSNLAFCSCHSFMLAKKTLAGNIFLKLHQSVIRGKQWFSTDVILSPLRLAVVVEFLGGFHVIVPLACCTSSRFEVPERIKMNSPKPQDVNAFALFTKVKTKRHPCWKERGSFLWCFLATV